MKCVGLEGGTMVRVYYELRQGRFCAPLTFPAPGGGGDEGLISKDLVMETNIGPDTYPIHR
jgi:hypothetical protein